ncbi:hypothetical protein ACKURH_22810 [Enterobacter soli]
MKKNNKKFSIKTNVDINVFNIPPKGGNELQIANIIEYLSYLNKSNNTRLIRKLASHILLPQRLCNIYSSSDPIRTYNFKGILSSENYFYWQVGLFEKNIELLKQYCNLRRLLNNELLFGDPNNSLSYLDQIDELTTSWWSLEIRSHINKEFLGKDVKKFFEEKAKILGEQQQLKYLSVMSEASVETHTKVLVDQLMEYKTADIEDVINFGECLRLLYLPPHKLLSLNDNKISLTILREYHGQPLLDQYILFKAIITSYNNNFEHIEPHKIEIIRELAHKIEDEELKNLTKSSSLSNDFVMNILDYYTSGKYSIVVENIRKNTSAEVYGLLELHSRAKAYIQDDNTFNLFETLSHKTSLILQIKESSNDNINSLVTICNKFRHESWAKSFHYHLSKILHEKYDAKQIESLRIQSLLLGNLNTPRAMIRDFIPSNSQYFKLQNLPFDRGIKYNSTKQMSYSITNDMFPIASDYIKLQSKIYIEKKDYSSLSSFISKCYFKNPLSCLFLPLNKACSLIEDVFRDYTSDHLSFMITLDINSKVNGKKYDDIKTEIFECYILRQEFYKPSEVFKEKELTEQELYFLRYICTLNQLDSIVDFISNDEVVIERVAIIDLLISVYRRKKDMNEVIALMHERDSVLESLFADNLRAKLETGKLYVDVQAMEAANKHKYQIYYEKAKQVEGGILLENIENDLDNVVDIFKIDDNKSVVASSKKMDLIVNLYYQCAKDFASSEEYGLDKYLSAEIRHNVFFSQIRACFEKSHLVTEHSDEGYASNKYWLNKYSYINSKFMALIDKRMKRFSEDLDAAINNINNRLRVVTYNDSDAIFDFSCYYSRAYNLSQIINESKDFNEFFDNIIDFMWSIAEFHAKTCQKIIAEDFRQEIIKLIENLEKDLISIKGKTAIVNLMDEIRLVKSIFSNEIENVINWFRFVGKNDRDEYETTEVVIDATISSFQAIYGHKSNKFNNTISKSSNLLTYRESRALFIALFTSLENAINYRIPHSDIELNHIVDLDFKDIIYIKNATNSFDSLCSAETFIESIKSTWHSNNVELNISEGGTGLYKMHDILHKCSKKFSLDILIPEKLNHFIAMVTIENENTIN